MIKYTPMQEIDSLLVFSLMRAFYDHVSPPISDDVIWKNIQNCTSSYPYAEGWVFSDENTLVGYAILSRGYLTQTARESIRVEDLYVAPAYRHLDIGQDFLKALPGLYPGCGYVSLESGGGRRESGRYRLLGYHPLSALMAAPCPPEKPPEKTAGRRKKAPAEARSSARRKPDPGK